MIYVLFSIPISIVLLFFNLGLTTVKNKFSVLANLISTVVFVFYIWFIVVLVTFRYNNGADFFNYLEIFNAVSSQDSFNDILSVLNGKYKTEPIFLFYMYLGAGLGSFIYLSFFAVISGVLLKLFFSFKNNLNYFIPLFVSITCITVFRGEFVQMRWALSFSWLIVSIYYLFEGKPKTSFTLSLISGLIHNYSFFIYLFYVLVNKFIDSKRKCIYILGLAFFVFVFIRYIGFEMINSMLPFEYERVRNYLLNPKQFGVTLHSLVYLFITSAIVILPLTFKKIRITKEYKMFFTSFVLFLSFLDISVVTSRNIYLVMTFLFTYLFSLASKNGIVFRLTASFVIVFVFCFELYDLFTREVLNFNY